MSTTRGRGGDAIRAALRRIPWVHGRGLQLIGPSNRR